MPWLVVMKPQSFFSWFFGGAFFYFAICHFFRGVCRLFLCRLFTTSWQHVNQLIWKCKIFFSLMQLPPLDFFQSSIDKPWGIVIHMQDYNTAWILDSDWSVIAHLLFLYPRPWIIYNRLLLWTLFPTIESNRLLFCSRSDEIFFKSLKLISLFFASNDLFRK